MEVVSLMNASGKQQPGREGLGAPPGDRLPGSGLSFPVLEAAAD